MTQDRPFIAARLREAWDTLRRMPTQDVPALRSGWPQTVQDVADAYGYTPATARLSPASPRAIDRMMETFTWFQALENAPHLTRAVWLTAASGMGIKRAALTLGIHRDTARARRDEALDRMAEWVRLQSLTPNTVPHPSRQA
ncbi:MAG: DUF6362 family protein [Micropepsaceae bacterium]